MSFPSQTILRFRPSSEAEPYVAIVLVEGGNILEVKRGGVTKRVIYSSIEEWLDSIDEHPTVDQLETRSKDELNDEKESKELKKEANTKAKTGAKVKEEKPVKEKKVKLNLIPRTERNYAIEWTYHIHKIIKEANPTLLTNKDVILAFNHLVDVLLQHVKHVVTTVSSSRYAKYTTGIDITDIESLKRVCQVRLDSVFYNTDNNRYVIRSHYYGSTAIKTPESLKMQQDIYEEILAAYLPLFELIKKDVIPYMEQQAKAIKNKENSDRILYLSERMESLQNVYEKELARRKSLIVRFTQSHERQLAELRSTLAAIMEKHK